MTDLIACVRCCIERDSDEFPLRWGEPGAGTGERLAHRELADGARDRRGLQPDRQPRGPNSCYRCLGHTVALTDRTGAVKTSYAYEPYGNTTASGEANANPAQYAGRENDGTGLYYYRARYYHPGFGRFVSEGPIA